MKQHKVKLKQNQKNKIKYFENNIYKVSINCKILNKLIKLKINNYLLYKGVIGNKKLLNYAL